MEKHNELIKYFKKGNYNKSLDIINSIETMVQVDLIGERLKRLLICRNSFKECNLRYNAFSGSTFNHVKFLDCHLQGNGFIGSTFLNVSIESHLPKIYTSNNWSQSFFDNCVINNAKIKSCTISQTLFLNTHLINIAFSAVTFENTTFRKCVLNNVNFSTVNIDFMEFDNCKLENVKFSFLSLPFVFGGLNALNGNINILDQNNRIIRVDEYIKILPTLSNYFAQKEEYFAVCNIHLFLENYDDAFEYLNKGIMKSLQAKDFRMIKYYCKLGVMGKIIQDEQAKQILTTIEKSIFIISNNSKNSSINQELLHYGEIRSLLLNRNVNKNKVDIVIKTKLSSDQHDDINLLLNTIDDALTSFNLGEDKNYIQVRHNSPFEIIVTYICQNLPTILGVTSSVFSIVSSFFTIKSLNKKYKKETPENRKQLILKEISKICEVDLSNPKKVINLELELACEKLKNTLKKAKKQEMDQIIDNFTSCIHNITNNELPDDVVLIKLND